MSQGSRKAPPLAKGSVINDRYEIQEGLGKGGMGEVFSAYDRSTQQAVALKIVREESRMPGDDEALRHELLLARCYLESVADRLRLLGLHVDTLAMVHANIAQAIEQQALDRRADMIALGTHGRSGWSRLALGSVTQDILRNARLPLLVIRGVETEADVDRSRITLAAC